MTTRAMYAVVVTVMTSCGVAGPGSAGAKVRQPIVSCPVTPAKEVFSSALCLCGDYLGVGDGAWVHGGAAGFNGSLDIVGQHTFSGDVVAWGGVSGVGELSVGGSLSTPGRVQGVGSLRVGGDLSAGLGVQSVGQLEVKGALRSPQAMESVGTAAVGRQGDYVALSAPPCACGAEQKLGVAAVIAAAKVKNDNAAIGLSLEESVGEHAMTLGSGSYFFAGIEAVGQHTLTIDGAVALHVSGGLDTVGDTHVVLTEGSTLDLYVDGDVSMVGDSSFGAGAAPGAVRLYVAGERTVTLVGSQSVVGSVYAPASDLTLVGDTEFAGSLFVRDVTGVGELKVTADAPMIEGRSAGLCD